MRKYDEIMERVKLTDEMRERILAELDRRTTASGRESRSRRWLPTMMLGCAAAVLALCTITVWNHQRLLDPSGGDSSDGLADAYYTMQEYASEKELSEAVGFPVPELTSLPFTAAQTEYRAIDAGLAEISYSGSDGRETLIFRKSVGTDENSGDYTAYAAEASIESGGCPVTLKGDGERWILASWTDGQYAYSISLPEGCGLETMERLVSEAMEDAP